MTDSVKYLLEESKAPKFWYNINADLPSPPPPPLHPGTKQPAGPDDFAPLFPMGLIMQEVSIEREIEIPEPVREIYKQWRPSPLYRARRLEKYLDTPAKIYFKYEGVSPTGSHKPNTAVAQAFYNKEEGVKKIYTETGAGQWGSSLAYAGQMFGIDIEVFMVKISFDQKPYRKFMMQSFGAKCNSSPSNLTDFGKKLLDEDPSNPGSLGIAISEAVESTVKSNGEAKYSLGSVLGHVLLHQTINGNEAILQMEQAGDYPDIIVGCTGGGSNLSGLLFPFLGQQLRGGKQIDVIACEPLSCPSFTKGKYAYDFGDMAMMTPLVKMHTLGSSFLPPANHSGGLRYHGMSYHLSHLLDLGLIRAKAYGQKECFEAGVAFAKQEGIIPAPEGNHAVKGAIDAALDCKKSGESKTILFNLCGHGHFDMSAYDDYFSGNLAEDKFDKQHVDEAISKLPEIG